MVKIVYLMRHGQTLFNELKKVQGWCDSPLTELGKEQARQARQYFQSQGIQFGQAYASTQERACDTLEIIITVSFICYSFCELGFTELFHYFQSHLHHSSI